MCALSACGLSLAGQALDLGSTLDGGAKSGSDDAAIDAAADTATDDTAASDALQVDGPIADAAVDTSDAGVCAPFDAGLAGAPSLADFSLAGDAAYDENSDGRITLTNSDNNQAGAAWYPTQLPAVAGYDLTWSLRVGPNDVSGDGITFAVLQTSTMPGVGDGGDGIGLRNIFDGGATGSGYAVDVDMYQNSSDPTDLGPTTLKLVTMPGFTVVAEAAVPLALNDGNTYAVDVTWRAPSTLTATLHTGNGSSVQVTSSDPGLATTAPAFFGFTGATGGGADSHNEIAGLTILDVCQ
jgi:hypothetical protein